MHKETPMDEAKVYVIETTVEGQWEPVGDFEAFTHRESAEKRRKEAYPDAPNHSRGPILYRVREYRPVPG